MAFIELPVAADVPYQSFSTTLNGAVYRIRLRYNTRAGFWSLDLADAAGAPLLSGLAIRLGTDLLSQFASEGFPPGKLFAVNWVAAHREPDRETFGRDVSLVYEEA